MKRQDDDHGLRAEMVHSAHQPAAADTVRDVLDAGPRGGGRRGVVRHQRPAGDGLEGDAAHENAAEDVSPTRAARNGLFERVFDERAVARAFVEPITEIFRASSSDFLTLRDALAVLLEVHFDGAIGAIAYDPRLEGVHVARRRARRRFPVMSKFDVWHGHPKPCSFFSMPHPR